jgi:transcriptional regulator with XRE-family HTH domain
MKINAELILELREEKSWSQDELSIASGLSLRTVQRIEKEGIASLQSKKSIASVFEIDISDLDYKEILMKTYEYKTVNIKFNFGIFKKGIPDIEKVLNEEGAKGWQMKQLIMPSAGMGESEQIIAVFERLDEK